MPANQRSCPGVWGEALGDPRDMAKAEGPPDDVVGAGGWLGGGELIYEVISCAGCWEWLWVKWCGAVGSAGAVHAARHVGQAPWPARHLGLSGSQRSPGSRAAAGRRAAIAVATLGAGGATR